MACRHVTTRVKLTVQLSSQHEQIVNFVAKEMPCVIRARKKTFFHAFPLVASVRIEKNTKKILQKEPKIFPDTSV